MTTEPKPLVRGEVQTFELPQRTELPAYVRRIRARHEISPAPETPAKGTPLAERALDELDVRIG